jgi:two-component system response regulator
VLLVEDNPTDLFVIKEAIEASGVHCDLRIARNGDDAIQYLQKLANIENLACPALVLLDLNLPKVTGIEVLRYLRTSPCRYTPVIVVTSSTAEADRIDVERLGAEAYFQKSNRLGEYLELTRLIQRFLGVSEEGP